MDFSEKKKEVIEKITGTLLDAMEQQLLSEEEGRVVAEYILSKKESFTNQEELIEFYKLFLIYGLYSHPYSILSRSQRKQNQLMPKNWMKSNSSYQH